jgi:hypothetical protein
VGGRALLLRQVIINWIDGLIREIAELDAAYGAGEIKEAAYQKRRGRLKGRLAELIDN